jgi:crossover junction endodeoxyribonuclease RuvC
MIRIMGIDPGTRYVGYAFLESRHHQSRKVLASGTINVVKEKSYIARLKLIRQQCFDLIEQYQPQQVAMESLFYHKNPGTLIKLAQARGVILAIILEKITTECFYEYSPNTIKSVIMGHGHTQKQWLQKGLRGMIRKSEEEAFSSFDESDALAVALCHERFYWDPSASNQLPKKKTTKLTFAQAVAHKIP